MLIELFFANNNDKICLIAMLTIKLNLFRVADVLIVKTPISLVSFVFLSLTKSGQCALALSPSNMYYRKHDRGETTEKLYSDNCVKQG